jgi:hypothetical protein
MRRQVSSACALVVLAAGMASSPTAGAAITGPLVPLSAAVGGAGSPLAAAAQVPGTVPPVLISPASPAKFAGSSSVTFTIRSFAGDDSLWLHVSESPEQWDSCGTIDDDVGLGPFTPTSDPAVYKASVAAEDFGSGGTFYWQAYRIHYGDGADGCVEAPVRTLVHGAYPALVPPVSLFPADGARFAANRSVTFRVRSFAGDDSLYLHVSGSDVEDGCGTIPDDYMEEFKPTSDPRVYTARVPASEFPGKGELYWQAHRIEHQEGNDFCVEGPIRTIFHGAAPRPPAQPRRVPGLYRGRTAQGRSLAFRLASSRTDIPYVFTSIRLGCSRGVLTTRLQFGEITVRSNGSFAQTLRSVTGQTATLTGKFRSATRATGTVSSRAPSAGIAGRCGFRRYSWTARRVGR